MQVVFEQGLVITVTLERRDNPLQNPRQLLNCFYMIAGHLAPALAYALSETIFRTVIPLLRILEGPR